MSLYASSGRVRPMFSATHSTEEQAMYLVPADARELDSRSSDGIDVTLLWSKQADRVWIAVVDEKSGDWFEQDVHPALALDAFQHPYAYANRDRDEFAIAA
jgi:hypothetical protein